MGFRCGSVGKESACDVGVLGSVPGLGRSPGGGKGHPLQYSDLENPMDYSPWGPKELDMTERFFFFFKDRYTHSMNVYWALMAARYFKG